MGFVHPFGQTSEPVDRVIEVRVVQEELGQEFDQGAPGMTGCGEWFSTIASVLSKNDLLKNCRRVKSCAKCAARENVTCGAVLCLHTAPRQRLRDGTIDLVSVAFLILHCDHCSVRLQIFR